MFGKTEEKTVQPVKTKKKLSSADKKQIEAAIARANRTDKKGKSAQDSIPYERMWPDGICRVSDSHYTEHYIKFLFHIQSVIHVLILSVPSEILVGIGNLQQFIMADR